MYFLENWERRARRNEEDQSLVTFNEGQWHRSLVKSSSGYSKHHEFHNQPQYKFVVMILNLCCSSLILKTRSLQKFDLPTSFSRPLVASTPPRRASKIPEATVLAQVVNVNTLFLVEGDNSLELATMSSPQDMYKKLQARLTEVSGGGGGGPRPRGLVGGVAGTIGLIGAAILINNSLFNVDGGHRAIKYTRVGGVSKEIYTEGMLDRWRWSTVH